jgi:hypothetical protein
MIHTTCTFSYLMATLKFSFIFSIVLLLLHSTKSTTPPLKKKFRPPICVERLCGTPELGLLFNFPFQLREKNQSDRCGYPGFEVYCKNNKQPLITLSNGTEFVIKNISYESQRIWMDDPNDCPPRRFLQNIDLDDSPFQWDNRFYGSTHYENVTFLNCTKNAKEPMFDHLRNIPCLSNGNYLIIFALQSLLGNLWSPSCSEIGSAKVPVKDKSGQPMVIMEGLYSNLMLRWNTPLCGCNASQYCGFASDRGLDLTCHGNYFDIPGNFL